MSVETIKGRSRYLRGSIAQELGTQEPSFGEESGQVLKFHGIYQQDDRDLRKGGDRTHILMVRAALPGGRLSAEQYLVADELADLVGDGTLRITSRQGLQWHRVGKADLAALIWTLNQSLVTTLGACGDVVRNVVACPDPRAPQVLEEVAVELAERFQPRTSSYWELWVDGERAVSAVEGGEDVEPVYGSHYLPRKFKIGIASPGDNCIDLLTHDLGFVPVEDGWVVTVGGGQGKSPTRDDTYPRLADPLATVSRSEIGEVAEAVVTVQRDWGERSDRKRARLKYLIDTWGLPRFRRAVEERLGWDLPEPEPIGWTSHADHLGWHDTGSLGVAVESGRISGGFRQALAAVVERHRPDLRFTPQQNLVITGLPFESRREVARELGVGLPTLSTVAMACVALPTCGLALTDAERALPQVTGELEGVLTGLGLAETVVTVRMTGCSNGCARPYTSEIGLVGRRRGRYDIHLGAAPDGTRLGEPMFESVRLEEVVATLEPLLAAWRDESDAITFGDFCYRLGRSGLVALSDTAGAAS